MFYPDCWYVPSTGVSVTGRNISSTGILVVFDGGVGLELKATEGAMNIFLTAPESFLGQTQGLMGTWNGNASDDFLTPENITLPSNLTTEELHYQFGLKCNLYEYICVACHFSICIVMYNSSFVACSVAFIVTFIIFLNNTTQCPISCLNCHLIH